MFLSLTLSQERIRRNFDDCVANMRRESHSMYQELLANTSGCNLHSFLDQLSGLLSRASLSVLHTQLYVHLSYTLKVA